jgi:SAM-dependent methyltransferase
VCADAEAMPWPDAAFDIVVASLADPFNTPRFWREAHRVLAAGGLCLFTTPADEWASRFRLRGNHDEAEFLLGDGRTVAMVSHVFSVSDQRAMLEAAGLALSESVDLFPDQIAGPRSPKLDVFDGNRVPVVRGFVVAK